MSRASRHNSLVLFKTILAFALFIPAVVAREFHLWYVNLIDSLEWMEE